jgi:hypothetical protein
MSDMPIVNREDYDNLRKEYLDLTVELEKARAELETLRPFQTKYLDRVKDDAIKEYGLTEHAEQWKERLTGTTEEEIHEQAKRLQMELLLNKPPYVDPSLINPRSNRPTSNVKKAMYETGRKAAEKVLGVNNGATRVIDRNYGIGAKRSAAPVPKPQYKPSSTPSRSEKHRRESILQQFRRFLGGK